MTNSTDDLEQYPVLTLEEEIQLILKRHEREYTKYTGERSSDKRNTPTRDLLALIAAEKQQSYDEGFEKGWDNLARNLTEAHREVPDGGIEAYLDDYLNPKEQPND